MVKSLKDKNQIPLLAVLAGNLALFYMALNADSVGAAEWAELARGSLKALPAGLGLALIGIVNALLSADMKARLVFWRWNDPLPGARAFSHYAKRDSRINLDKLKQAHGPFPRSPREQNAVWYGFYRSVASEPAVTQVHRGYLFARDYTGISLLLILVLGGLAAYQMPAATAGRYIAFLIVQFLIVGLAARHLGCRFVTTVLALKGAGS